MALCRLSTATLHTEVLVLSSACYVEVGSKWEWASGTKGSGLRTAVTNTAQ
jgi:hypothetical protein